MMRFCTSLWGSFLYIRAPPPLLGELVFKDSQQCQLHKGSVIQSPKLTLKLSNPPQFWIEILFPSTFAAKSLQQSDAAARAPSFFGRNWPSNQDEQATERFPLLVVAVQSGHLRGWGGGPMEAISFLVGKTARDPPETLHHLARDARATRDLGGG